jgi:hypothetical protein
LVVACRYFPPQQSPGQHDDPVWQQLAPQQLPGQHFAPDVQQAAPVAASAVRENSDAANRAKTFAFMEKLLSVEKGISCARRTQSSASAQRRLATHREG